jgi:hypothetical protein
MLVLLMIGIYTARRWNGLRGHDISSKFHGNRFRHLSNITVITATNWEAVILILLIGANYEVGRWDDFVWHDMLPSFMKIGTDTAAILRLCLGNLTGCNVGISDVRDLWNTPLRWPWVPSYNSKFHNDWFRHSKIVRGPLKLFFLIGIVRGGV